MIVARGLGRGAYFGAIVAVGLCITTPPAEAVVTHTQVYGGKYRDDVSREIVEKQWELIELRKAREETDRQPDETAPAKPIENDAGQAASPSVFIEYPLARLLTDQVDTVEIIKPAELVASQADDDKAKKAALLRKRQDEEALLMILLNL